MLSLGIQTVSTACLRCQLHQVLASLRGRRTQVKCASPLSRCFCRNVFNFQESAQIEPYDERRANKRRYEYRHIHPNGRIIGRPGRWQQTLAERLATKSLGKPAEVIVFRDVIEESDSPRTTAQSIASLKDGRSGNAGLSAEEIEAMIVSRGRIPEQEEVNASIDTLRPHSSVLNEPEFKHLADQLLESYSTRQLAQYLIHTLALPTDKVKPLKQHARKRDDSKIGVLPWQPGRTSIETRRGIVAAPKKGESGTPKTRLADDVLRRVWKVTIRSEEQQVGELEIRMQPWQLAMLFDVTYDSKPVFHRMIDSQLLFQASEIRAHRPDRVVRITARRQDAEEISKQLQEKLACVGRLDVDLTLFIPLLPKGHGSTDVHSFFSPEDIAFVANRTASVIERDSQYVLSIFCQSRRGQLNARRLLLSLLDLPSPTVTDSILPTVGSQRNKTLKTFYGSSRRLSEIEYYSSGLHRRDSRSDMQRLIAPIVKRPESEETSAVRNGNGPEASVGISDWRRIGHQLTKRLEHFPALQRDVQTSASDWVLRAHGLPSHWTALLCVLLHPISKPAAAEPNVHKLTRACEVPSIHQLLSYFETLQSKADTQPEVVRELDISAQPYLLAHLIPSPFSAGGFEALRNLPRLTLRSQLGVLEQQGRRSVNPIALKAVLAAQELNVPFPDQVADLVFERSISMTAKHDLLLKNDQLRAFSKSLQDSLSSSSGMLDALPALDIPLPSWIDQALGRPITAKRSDHTTPVPYLLDRFEQSEYIELVPLGADRIPESADREVRSILAKWPENLVLQVRELHSGAFGGRRTELRITSKGSERRVAASESLDGKGSMGDTLGGTVKSDGQLLQLTKTAMDLLKLLTRVDAGDLKSMHSIRRV